MRLKDKVAIITGAGAGIGEAIAVRFADEGAQLVLNDLHDSPSLRTAGAVVLGDIAREEVARELAQRAVERFGRSKPDRLEFVRVEFGQSERETSRQAFCARLSRLLAEQSPDETVESLTTASDLEHSLSGSYARGVLRRGSSY